MEEENLNTDTLPQGDGNDVGSGGGDVSDSPKVSLKSVLKKELNKDFADEEAAVKAAVDTFRHVGKVGQEKAELEKKLAQLQQNSDPSSDVRQEVAALKAEIRSKEFYGEHPELKEYQGLLSKFDNDPYAAFENEEFKKIYEKLGVAHEGPTKSVLQTNSRIAQDSGTDYQSDMARAEQTGNWAEFLAKHKGVRLQG